MTIDRTDPFSSGVFSSGLFFSGLLSRVLFSRIRLASRRCASVLPGMALAVVIAADLGGGKGAFAADTAGETAAAAIQGVGGPARSTGQRVYVPVYSSILHGNEDRSGKPGEWLLSVMLSLRNTDPDHSIRITSVRYFDGAGGLLRDFLTEPRVLVPLGATNTFVENRDRSGGSGASFIVTWESGVPVSPPMIEALHTDLFGTRSVVFSSRGQVIPKSP